MKRKIRVGAKLLLVVLLTVLFVLVIHRDQNRRLTKQPEGEQISSSDVWILLEELKAVSNGMQNMDVLEEIHSKMLTEQETCLSYGRYREIWSCLEPEKEPLYKERYQDSFFLLKKDWYESYEKLIEDYGLTGQLERRRVDILCGSGAIVGENSLPSGSLLGKDGEIYQAVSEECIGLKMETAEVFAHGDKLLTLIQGLPDRISLSNIWIMEDEDSRICFFYKGYEIISPYEAEKGKTGNYREQVADLSCKQGRILEINPKTERISGKLLGISGDSLTVEGYGELPVKEGITGYQLYDTLRESELSELLIGYDFSDFVMEDGKICAFLLTRREEMEAIRVAIKTDQFGGLYHDTITFSCQDPVTIRYGEQTDRKEEMLPAGEELTLSEGDPYLEGGRVELSPAVNTGKIQVLSLTRSQGTPAYRGSMEVVETEEGLVLINEVLLEEYLYSVVPSEMPASYPIEALKAQAVCARTYGYRYLEQPGYPALGAHVDDSVGYQVYNNIPENINSTKAVKETAGLLLLYGDEPASTYYYSTSCGYGSDAGVWDAEKREQFPYLNALYIAEADSTLLGEGDGDLLDDALSPEEIAEEELFGAYIGEGDENAYEKEEPWFRWEYQVKELDAELLFQRMKERYGASPGKVLTFAGKDGDFEDTRLYETKKPKAFKKVEEIRCLARRQGGVMDALLIKTDQGTYKILSEYNIRYILNQGGKVIRQDGSDYESTSLLPSAYFVIEVVKVKGNVVGYTISGGGYGHGAGMSQNGARAMSLKGKTCEEILNFFFRDCYLTRLYE